MFEFSAKIFRPLFFFTEISRRHHLHRNRNRRWYRSRNRPSHRHNIHRSRRSNFLVKRRELSQALSNIHLFLDERTIRKSFAMKIVVITKQQTVKKGRLRDNISFAQAILVNLWKTYRSRGSC